MTLKKWITSFKRVRFFIHDEHRSRRQVSVPTLVIIDLVHDIVLQDCRIGLKQISEAMNTHEDVHHIVQVDLDMSKISGK